MIFFKKKKSTLREIVLFFDTSELLVTTEKESMCWVENETSLMLVEAVTNNLCPLATLRINKPFFIR